MLLKESRNSTRFDHFYKYSLIDNFSVTTDQWRAGFFQCHMLILTTGISGLPMSAGKNRTGASISTSWVEKVLFIT